MRTVTLTPPLLETAMSTPRYTAMDLAGARHLITHVQKLQALGWDDADEILATAWAILREDRQAQLAAAAPTRAPITGPARIYRQPVSVWQAGHRSRRLPTLILWPQNPNHPGDAA